MKKKKKNPYKCLSFHSSEVAFKYQIVYHSASDHIYVNRNRRKHKEDDLNLQRPQNLRQVGLVDQHKIQHQDMHSP